MKTRLIEQAYKLARERYAALGVDCDRTLKQLSRVAMSLHCWQGDDICGFEQAGTASDGGLQVTGNYPGRARNGDELRADLEFLLGQWQRLQRRYRRASAPALLHQDLELVERVLERPLAQEEREDVLRVGALLGGHPEGLRLAAADAREMGWKALRAALEAGKGTEGWDPLHQIVDRQWGRMKEAQRKRMERLMWWTARGGPLEVPLAMALWGEEEEAVRRDLADLERTGMVEQLTAHPAEWWQEGEVTRWRVTPMVYRLQRERAGKREKRRRQWERAAWRARAFLRRLPDRLWKEMRIPDTPRPLAVVTTLTTVIAIIPKTLILLLLMLIEWVIGQRGWAQRWNAWTVTGQWMTQLQRRWQRLGVQPLEELELLRVWTGWKMYMLLGLELVGGAVAAVLSSLPEALQPYPILDYLPEWVGTVGILTLMYIFGVGMVSWVYWLDVLYGVRTWDLALMVKMALGLSWLLGWIPGVRKERERLREAWKRWEGVGTVDR